MKRLALLAAVAIAYAVRSKQRRGSLLNHVFCCDEGTSLCGLDISRDTYEPGCVTTCPLCLWLDSNIGCCIQVSA